MVGLTVKAKGKRPKKNATNSLAGYFTLNFTIHLTFTKIVLRLSFFELLPVMSDNKVV